MKKNYKRNWLFKLKMLAVVGSLFFAGSAMAQLSGTYTIDSASVKSGTNFQSFQELVDTLDDDGVSGAVIVNVVAGSGPYEGELDFGRISGVSATQTVTINGNGNEIKSDEYGIYLEGTQYVIFDNLKVVSASSRTNYTAFCFRFGLNANFNIIRNCELVMTDGEGTSTSTVQAQSAYIYMAENGTNSWWRGNASDNIIENNKMWNGSASNNNVVNAGVLVSGYISNSGLPSRNIFRNNEIRDFNHAGFLVRNGVDNEFVGNRVHSNDAIRIGYGMRIEYQQGGRIDSNTIENLESDGTFYGIYNYAVQGSQGDEYTVKGNTIDDNQSGSNSTFYGIYQSGFTGANATAFVHTEDNQITGNEGRSIYGIYNSRSENMNIRNNVISHNENSSPEFGRNYGVYMYWAAKNINIAHNTFYVEDSAYYNVGTYMNINGEVDDDYNLVNNIFSDNTDAQITYSIGAWVNSTTRPSTIDNNIYHTTIPFNFGTTRYGDTVLNVIGTTGSPLGTNWADAGFDLNGLETDADLTDPTNGDWAPQNPAIGNIGLAGFGDKDITGADRTACGPDPGVTEFFTNYSADNLVHVTVSDICGNTQPDITMDITNPYGVDLIGTRIYYNLNNGDDMIEKIDTVGANSTVNYEFDNPPFLFKPGANTITVGAFCDDDASDNTVTQTFNVIAVPSGGLLTPDATAWDGYIRGGTMASPDVTVNGYEINYDIERPTQTGFTAAPGAAYTYSIEARTANGTDVTSLGFSLNGEVVTVDPAASLSDSMVFVEVTATSVAAGCDTSFGRWLFIPHTPVPSFTFTDICLGDVAEFRNTSTLLGPDFITTRWDFNDPSGTTEDNSDIKDGFYQYEEYGSNVPVTMTVANGIYPIFTYDLTQNINITPKPIADFKVLNACEGTPITIDNSTDLPAGVTGNITYTWDFGGEFNTTGNSPSYTFGTPGQRTITMIASANGCDAELTKNAYQFELPAASFASQGECNFVPVDFLNNSTIENEANMGFAWDFNGEGESRSMNPSFSFATPGTKTVTLTATSEFGCANSFQGTVTLSESPEADFTFDRACNLTPINFTRTGSVPNNGQNSSYAWDFNGEDATNQENPSYLFERVGTKQVTLTISDQNGCESSITKDVDVVLQAVADFDAQNVCDGDEAVFTNKSTVAAGNLSYVWSFGDGNSSTDLAGKHKYTEAKIYNVTLEAIVDGGCSDAITKQVVVQPSPDASFTPTTSGREVSFNSTEDANDAYRWTFGQGGKADQADPTYTYPNVDRGTFTVCLATRKGDCWSEECQEVTIDLAGVAELTENNEMINVYPNPTSGKFNVTVENASDVVVKVGDILGNVLDVQVIDNLNGTYNVDMSAVADGVYFVQVKNGDYFATKRITVSK